MNQRAEAAVIEKFRSLRPESQLEAEDFLEFLRLRDEQRALTQAATKSGEPAFAAVWENDEDAEYDRL